MKVLFVIGASSDLGSELIQKNVGRYDFVWAHYFHWNEKLENIKSIYGDKISFICADLSHENEIKEMIELIKTDGRIPNQIVHFPMTKLMIKKFAKSSWKEYEDALNVTLRSAVMISQSFLPYMKKCKYGKLLFVLSSVTSGIPPKYESSYVTVKYALLGLMKSLAVEYGDSGICINGISPDMIQTKFISDVPELLLASYSQTRPGGKILSVEEIIPVIDFILSDGADKLNGENICVG